MQRFVKHGDVVVVKPNIGWDRTPEQAANTNPFVVETVVKMCLEAGAKIVKVFDNTCNDARRTYKNTGIYAAVKRAGGTIYYVSDWKFYPAKFPAGSFMQEEPLFRDAVECDCFINVPIAKHHLTDSIIDARVAVQTSVPITYTGQNNLLRVSGGNLTHTGLLQSPSGLLSVVGDNYSFILKGDNLLQGLLALGNSGAAGFVTLGGDNHLNGVVRLENSGSNSSLVGLIIS